MKNEQPIMPSPDGGELLSKKEAQQEYLMMRMALGLNKDGELTKLNESTGNFENVKPSKEDLDKAYEKISEIIKLAEEEPDSKKFLCALGRILNSSSMITAKIITHVLAISTRLLFPFGKEDRTKPAWDAIDRSYESIKQQLVDAQKILNDYKKRANKSAQYQNQE